MVDSTHHCQCMSPHSPSPNVHSLFLKVCVKYQSQLRHSSASLVAGELLPQLRRKIRNMEALKIQEKTQYSCSCFIYQRIIATLFTIRLAYTSHTSIFQLVLCSQFAQPKEAAVSNICLHCSNIYHPSLTITPKHKDIILNTEPTCLLSAIFLHQAICLKDSSILSLSRIIKLK